MLALDGGVGEVIIAPTEDEVSLLKERSLRRAQALAGSTGKGATFDGYPVKLLANIGTVDDALKASKVDLEGSGLFRTGVPVPGTRGRALAGGTDGHLHEGPAGLR